MTKEKATIYDLWRVCKNYVGNCADCPLKGNVCTLGSDVSTKEMDEMNKIILKWCKEHPVKTRQDKFLELFPNAALQVDGVLRIKPCHINEVECESENDCNICRSKYWLVEVEE